MTTIDKPAANVGMNTISQANLSSPPVGFIIFKPLEAKFIEDTDLNPKMLPYCKFKLGWHTSKTEVSTQQGTNPRWADIILLERKHNENFAKVKIKDKDKIPLNRKLGEAKIPLDEVIAKGSVIQWFNLEKKHRIVGEIMLDMRYNPNL